MRYKLWITQGGRRTYSGAYRSLESLRLALAHRGLSDGDLIEVQVVRVEKGRA